MKISAITARVKMTLCFLFPAERKRSLFCIDIDFPFALRIIPPATKRFNALLVTRHSLKVLDIIANRCKAFGGGYQRYKARSVKLLPFPGCYALLHSLPVARLLACRIDAMRCSA